ncbi:ArnT family glycosyltransferase [Pinibacter aurantiacus]|uniref:Glycosyltransferase family 39 protein n=1 Tax=Pinibacter aurantiacus TaxID=2851599 RepID=A0A9E2SD37_9BACT|nr:glycosyltransferase family 39 protein [Pinibacter aurantiacus]MBV4359892.1 glycosyltransferase family 39 protein [Pinibacter aurantiacus]
MNFLASFDNWLRKPSALCILLGAYIILSFVCLQYRSTHSDENDYYSYTLRCLRGKPERISAFDDSKTMLLIPAVLPRVVAQVLNPQLKRTDGGHSDILNGRYAMIIFAIAMLVFLWLFLKKTNLNYSMLVFPLAIIDPFFLTYSTVLTSDMAVGMCTIAFLYFAFQFYTSRKFHHLLLMSVAIGLGIVGKFSFAPILMGFGIGTIILFYRKLNGKANLLFLLKSAVISALVILFVINIAYPTDRRFIALKNESFQSERFNSMSKSFLGSIPVPLPINMIHAADMLSYHGQLDIPESDETFIGATWLFRSFHQPPVWYYYWLLLLIITPIFLLMLFSIGTLNVLARAQKNKFVFLATIVALLYCLYGGLFNRFQIGARHLLSMYPLLFITSGYALHVMGNYFSRKNFQIVCGLGGLWMIASVLYFFPHEMAYTNEFITDKRTAHWYVNEGVIDYGQLLEYEQDFRKNNPQYKNPLHDTTKNGKYAISSGALLYFAYRYKDPKSQELLRRKPDRVERFVLLIFE